MRDGFALLYGCLHDWLAGYATLAALGVKEDGMPEALFARMVEDTGAAPPRRASGADRGQQIAAFVAAAGE